MPVTTALQLRQQPFRQDGVVFGALLGGHGFNDPSDLLVVPLRARLDQLQE